MVEFESLMLSVYLVGIWLVGTDNDKLKKSVIIIKSSLCHDEKILNINFSIL